MPNFLGQKISLISKAGIRYEGILYTIDPTESTVALSKVKSFGTEKRISERFIPPRDEVYEYIIFRGSDISDLHVCENSLYSEDSAIVEIMSPTFTNQSPMHVTMPQHNSPDSHLHNQDLSPSGFLSKPNPPDNRIIKNSPLSHSNKLVDRDMSNFSEKSLLTQRNQETSKSYQQKNDNSDMDKIATNDYYNFMNREHVKYDMFKNDDERENNYRRGNPRGNQRGMRHQDTRRGSQFNAGGNGIPSNRGQRANREITVEPIKDDFDFETSNALLAEALAKIDFNNEEQRNKSVSESKDVSDVTVSDYGDDKPYYDKSRSFFDNISSEMSERSNNDRINERRSNTETFGDSNFNRGNRGNRFGNRRSQFRGNYSRGSSAGFLRRGNNFNRGEMRGRGQVGGSNTNKRLISVGGNRGNINEN